MITLVLALLLSTAQAQPPEARARELFERGMQAAAEQRLDDARVLFRESLALFPTAAAAYNLAVVCRDAGEVADAYETAEALLRGRYGRLDDARRAEVRHLHEQVAARVALIEITIRGAPAADTVVRVDDRAVSARTVPLTPGSHRIRAEAPDGRTAERTVDAPAGETRRVELAFAPPPLQATGTLAPATPPRDREPTPITDANHAWIWAVVGAAIVGALAVTVWLALPDDDLPPASASFSTLRWPVE